MKNKNYIDLLFPIIILFSLYTLFQGWIPHWGIVILGSLGMGVLILLFSYPSFLTKPFFVFYLFFICFIFLNILVGDDYWCKKSFFELASVLLTMLVSILALQYYFLNPSEKKPGRRLINVVFFIIIVSTFATAILSISIPQVIRFAMMDENQDELLHQLYHTGMSNYYLPHAIPIVIPALVYHLKLDTLKKTRVIVACILILCISLVYFSGAMTALLLSLIALLGSVLISNTGNNSRFFIVLLVFLLFSPLIFNQDLQLYCLGKLETVIDEDNFFYDKIIDLENSLTSDVAQGDIDVRSSLYEDSWNGFLYNPLFGTNKEIGGHSTNLDYLASMGIVGFLPFVFLLLYVYIWTKQRLPKLSVPFYSLGYFIGIIMLCIKSMSNIEMWFFLFTFLPVVLNNASFVRKKSAYDRTPSRFGSS